MEAIAGTILLLIAVGLLIMMAQYDWSTWNLIPTVVAGICAIALLRVVNE